MHTYRVVIVWGDSRQDGGQGGAYVPPQSGRRTTYYLSSRSIDGAVAGAIKEHRSCFPDQTITSVEVAK